MRFFVCHSSSTPISPPHSINPPGEHSSSETIGTEHTIRPFNTIFPDVPTLTTPAPQYTMPPLKPEKPTRIQPHRAAKTPPATQTKIVLTTGGDRVTKKSTTPKLGQKQLKSPIKGAASIPNKSIGDGEDGEDGEETVTENPFADVTVRPPASPLFLRN